MYLAVILNADCASIRRRVMTLRSVVGMSRPDGLRPLSHDEHGFPRSTNPEGRAGDSRKRGGGCVCLAGDC